MNINRQEEVVRIIDSTDFEKIARKKGCKGKAGGGKY